MKQILNIIINENNDNNNNIVEKMNEFYVEVIDQKLYDSNLTQFQKISVINGIMDNIKKA